MRCWIGEGEKGRSSTEERRISSSKIIHSAGIGRESTAFSLQKKEKLLCLFLPGLPDRMTLDLSEGEKIRLIKTKAADYSEGKGERKTRTSPSLVAVKHVASKSSTPASSMEKMEGHCISEEVQKRRGSSGEKEVKNRGKVPTEKNSITMSSGPVVGGYDPRHSRRTGWGSTGRERDLSNLTGGHQVGDAWGTMRGNRTPGHRQRERAWR